MSGHPPPDPLGPVVVTARDIYEELVLVRRSVDQLVGDHQDAEEKLRDHEARIRALERGRWPLPSLAALCALAAVVVSVLALVG